MENIELEDLVYTYPKYNDPNIQTLITSKEEFREVAATASESVPKRGELFKHQKYLKRLMLQYDNQMVAWATGSGKSCGLFSISEHYKALAGALEEIRETNINAPLPPYKRAYIIVKGQSLIDDLKFQLLCKCTDGDYITEQIINSKTESSRKSNITRSISKYYTITTYETFAKSLLKMTDEQLHNEFDNCLFFVDEVHNINKRDKGLIKKDPKSGNEYQYKMKKNKKTGETEEKLVVSRLIYDQIWRLFHTVNPRKAMLFSATPMINDASEIGPIMNLLLPKDNQIPDNFNWKTVTLEKVEPYFRGLISYVRALDTGAIPVYQGKLLDAEYDIKGVKVKSQMVVYGTKMSDKQGNIYRLAEEDPLALRPDSKDPQAFDDLKRQAANFVFPDDSIATIGYNKYVIEKGNYIEATPEFEKILETDLRELSAKFYEIVKLCKQNPGSCWCYSNYIRRGGANVLGLCFNSQGFERYNESSSVFQTLGTGISVCGSKSLDDKTERKVRIEKKLRYGLLTSETTSSEDASLLELFNSYENRHGEYIKAIIGSPVTRDGLNFANVLQIHLVEPAWNQAGNYQAESRAIRSTSHVDLIEEEKERLKNLGLNPDDAYVTINVYRHAALNDKLTSVDVKFYEYSEKKSYEIKKIFRMMKQTATDCQINYARNVRPKDINGTAICDYDVCQYKCFNPAPTEIDYTSFDVLYSDDIIESIKLELYDIFRVIFQIPFEKLYNELEGYRKKFIDMAVTDLVENKIVLKNRYGYDSYLREDRGTLFLNADYPISLYEKEGAVALSEYSSNLIGIQTMTLNEYNGSLQRGTGNILDILNGLDEEEINQKIDDITLENKILMLEEAINTYYINQINTPIIKAVIDKFRNFIFKVYEPVKTLEFSRKALSERGTGRGRKPKEDTKFKFTIKQKETVDKLLKTETGKNLIFFHNLHSISQAQTAHSITAKSRRTEGKIRLLDNIGWRDANENEEIVYKEIIKTKEERIEFDIYGTIEQDEKFRIIDKTIEKADTKDTRKIKRGKICFNGWKKPELIDLFWKLNFNPFEVDDNVIKKDMKEYLVSQNISGVNKFTKDKLKFYYTLYNEWTNINVMCDYLEEYFEEQGRMIRK